MSARCSVATRSTATFSRARSASPAAICAANTSAMRPSASDSSGWLTVATKSWRRSATTQPSALVRPGRAGISTVGIASSLRERGGVQRPGAAEREQREVARVVAAREAHHADRAGHLVVGDADDRRRGRGRVEAERRADLLDERGADRIERDGVLDREQPVGIEAAEDDVGVGDRHAPAAAAVADRPRRRRPRSPGRRAASPKRRPKRSSRRRRRSCGRRPSARGSASRTRARGRSRPSACRRGRARRRSTFRPCRR